MNESNFQSTDSTEQGVDLSRRPFIIGDEDRMRLHRAMPPMSDGRFSKIIDIVEDIVDTALRSRLSPGSEATDDERESLIDVLIARHAGTDLGRTMAENRAVVGLEADAILAAGYRRSVSTTPDAPYPKAEGNDALGGWTIKPSFLDDVRNRAVVGEDECTPSWETTEGIILAYLALRPAPWHNGRARDPKANHEFRPVDSRADDAQKRAPGEHAIALTAEAASFLNDLEEHPLDPPREIKAVHFGENPRFDDAQKPVESLPALLARVEHNLTLRHVYPHEESRAEIAGLAARLRALSGAVSETYCVSCDHPACGVLFEVAFQPRSDVTLYCPKHARK